MQQPNFTSPLRALGLEKYHCCQIPPELLGQFSQKNSAARKNKLGRKPATPPNHQKKCSKKILLQIFGSISANY
jgi:hypothetical protein